MSLWTGPGQQHVDGHKELTNYNDIVTIDAPKTVYIPLINGLATSFEVLVKENDRVLVNTKIAVRNDNFTVPLFSPVSGVVKGVKKVMHASLKPIDHLVIENDGLYEATQSLHLMDYETSSREELIQSMMDAGIVGMGGAGFPTYIKYKFAKDIHTVVINGVECEPYITADYRMMENYMDDLIVGTLAMIKMADAKKAMITVKKTKGALIKKLQEATQAYENIEISPVPDVYPMGWERTLVYQLFKKRYDKLPSELGLIVNNATTAIAFAQAITKGQPTTHKMVTVSGDGVKSPSNVFVSIGTPASEIIAQLGGYTAENISLVAGGPMMGKTIVNDQFVVTPYTNAITVLKTKPLESIPCLRCGKCNDFCPAGLLPVRINNAEESKNIDMIAELRADLCIECGLCSYVCPSRLDVTEGVRKAKRILLLKKGA
jgi:electron transport complex protein RnfC